MLEARSMNQLCSCAAAAAAANALTRSLSLSVSFKISNVFPVPFFFNFEQLFNRRNAQNVHQLQQMLDFRQSAGPGSLMYIITVEPIGDSRYEYTARGKDAAYGLSLVSVINEKKISFF